LIHQRKRVLTAEDRFAPVGGGNFLLRIVFGFLTAITGDFDLAQTWLVIAYVLTAFILGDRAHVPPGAGREAQGGGRGR
jgi:hypothetical protein